MPNATTFHSESQLLLIRHVEHSPTPPANANSLLFPIARSTMNIVFLIVIVLLSIFVHFSFQQLNVSPSISLSDFCRHTKKQKHNFLTQDGCTPDQINQCKSKCGDRLKSCTCPMGVVQSDCFPPATPASTPLNIAAIAGGAAGGGVCLICIVVLIVVVCRRNKTSNLDYVSERHDTSNVIKMKESDIL